MWAGWAGPLKIGPNLLEVDLAESPTSYSESYRRVSGTKFWLLGIDIKRKENVLLNFIVFSE